MVRRIDDLKTLLKYKPSLEIKNNDGITPLHKMCSNSRNMTAGVISIKSLIENGALINSQTKEGNTPLHLIWYGGIGKKCLP